jgi:hypothetical protein
MPVTAKLSRRFYEALGDDVANELVDWFNAVDLTYRTELRELNDLNWARFEAKLSEGLTQVRADFTRHLAEHRMANEAAINRLEVKLATQKADLIRWMFLFWLGTLAVNVANRLL